MSQGGYQVIIILPIKSKMAAAKKQSLSKTRFNPFLSAHIPYAQSEGILPKYLLLQ